MIVPKGFPHGAARMGCPRRSLWDRLPGPAGAVALHGVLLALIFHFQVLREVCGQRAAEELEWTWLPEVTLIPPVPEPPPPEPEPLSEPPPEPMPEPVVESEPEPEPEPEPPADPVVVAEPPPPMEEVVEEVRLDITMEESPPEPEAPKEPDVEPPPPPPPPMMAETTPLRVEDAWAEVRSGIQQSLRYPTPARRTGTEGVVVLRLTLDGSGSVVGAEVRPPYPERVLCEAALSAVRRAGPFPKTGRAIRKGETLSTAEIAVRFELRRGRS